MILKTTKRDAWLDKNNFENGQSSLLSANRNSELQNNDMEERFHYKFNDSISDDSIFIRIKHWPRLYNMQIKFKILKTEVSENYPFRKNSQVIGNKTLGPSRFLILQTPTNPLIRLLR